MNYIEAVSCLERLNTLGSRPGLETISELLKRLGNPQDKQYFVHIAGTNGKGSVGAFLESILTDAGYNVGRYSSPAVFEQLEIIKAGGRNISREDFASVISEIKSACDNMVSDGFAHPTRFEMETAAAFMYFYRKKCNIAIVECGMGGDLDATNIIKNTVCSVITGISRDHTAFLGDTVEEIASHKAGIIKPDSHTVCLFNEKYVHIIENRASQLNNQVSYVYDNDVSNLVFDKEKNTITFDYNDTTGFRLNGLQIKIIGTYQPLNAALAVRTVQILHSCGYKISRQNIRSGLLDAVWRGRFQFLGHNPDFIIDGAHNPDGAKALEDCIKKYFPDTKLTFIIAVFSDKDIGGILEHIIPYASQIIATATPGNSRALPAKKLAQYIETYYDIKVMCRDNITDAVELALNTADSAEEIYGSAGHVPATGNAVNAVIACGSLSHLAYVESAYRLLTGKIK